MNNQTIDYYNQNADVFFQDTASADMRTLYEPFLACIPEHGKILDCGCGSGRDTKFFLEHGFSVSALDASRELCRIAEKHTGIPVQNITFDQISSISEYDGIWACASLLHVEREELPSLMIKFSKALVSTGFLYASFKYGDYSGLRNNRYFTDMTESSLDDLLQKSGCFQIHSLWLTGDVREGRNSEKWLNVLLRKKHDQ